MSKTYCEGILHHFRDLTKMVITDASLPALLLLLTIIVLLSPCAGRKSFTVSN